MSFFGRTFRPRAVGLVGDQVMAHKEQQGDIDDGRGDRHHHTKEEIHPLSGLRDFGCNSFHRNAGINDGEVLILLLRVWARDDFVV